MAVEKYAGIPRELLVRNSEGRPIKKVVDGRTLYKTLIPTDRGPKTELTIWINMDDVPDWFLRLAQANASISET